MVQGQVIIIHTGELKTISKGFFSSLQVIYGGMPSSDTFTLSPIFNEADSDFTTNIYYDVNTKIIYIKDTRFGVVQVTKEKIILKPL